MSDTEIDYGRFDISGDACAQASGLKWISFLKQDPLGKIEGPIVDLWLERGSLTPEIIETIGQHVGKLMPAYNAQHLFNDNVDILRFTPIGEEITCEMAGKTFQGLAEMRFVDENTLAKAAFLFGFSPSEEAKRTMDGFAVNATKPLNLS